MIVVGFWKIMGVYFFYIQVILYFELDHRGDVMLPYFKKYKGVILIEIEK